MSERRRSESGGAGKDRLRLLLVEDDPLDAKLLMAALDRFRDRYEIEHVGTFAEAMRSLEASDHDLLLLDLSLPDSRKDTTRERIPELANRIATVVLTGLDDPELGSELVNGGAQDYLPKNALEAGLMRRVIDHSVERFRSARSLERAREEALSASVVKSNFVAATSHEIRTPLNAILGMADLLSESQLDDQQREYVRVFQRSGRALLSLINDVLDLASIEHGKLDLRSRAWSIRELLEETAGTFAFEAHKKRIGLTVEVDPEVPSIVRGDPDRVRQVLSNLLSNAIKFTHEGCVSMRAVALGAEEVAFEIRDTGIGIQPDKLLAVFEPFERADHDPSHVYGGTGLGLSLCRELTTRMGGRIEALEAEGGGALLRVVLPVPTIEANDVAAAPTTGDHVLLAVASDREREVIERFCSRVCRSLDSVANAADAIRLARAHPDRYSMVIVDCRLPDGGGFSVIDDLPEALHARLLVLLPMDHRPSDLDRCRSRSADAIIKPVREERLVDWLSGRAAANASHATTDASEPIEAALIDRLRGARVLHADDSADNRLLVSSYLAGTGVELTEVHDGAEAVEAFRPGHFDAILIDVQMPRMNGLEAIRRIRALEASEGAAEIPILAITANVFHEQATECLSAGANGHVGKPVRKRTLLESLARCLGGERAPIESPKVASSGGFDLSAIDPEIRTILPIYLERRQRELVELRAALADRDFASLRRTGHNLKGSGGAYGMLELTEAGADLETASSNEDLAGATTAIDRIEGLVRDIGAAMDRAELD